MEFTDKEVAYFATYITGHPEAKPTEDHLAATRAIMGGLARDGWLERPTTNGVFQWGVRTTYTDGSQGVDWTNEDEARSFLAHYADCDAEQHMRVRIRELVRRPIQAGEIGVAESNYDTRRQAADRRAKTRAGRA